MVILKRSAVIIKKLKMADNDSSPCSSGRDEYSDPLEIAARAGARLSTPDISCDCLSNYCNISKGP